MGSQSRALPNVRTGKRRPATRAFFRGLVLSVAALMSALTCAVRAGEDAWEALSLEEVSPLLLDSKRMTRHRRGCGEQVSRSGRGKG